MGLSLLFPGSGHEQKKKAMPSHRFPQIPYGARVAPQRCPILRMSKAITIMPKVCCYYSFVAFDSFSFVH